MTKTDRSSAAKAEAPLPESIPQPAHCGSKPKKLAIGIAPLGTVSIGIVPMGVVCIGVVPMGVVSIGVVAMGVINASVVGMGVLCVGLSTMGVWTAGPLSMGLFNLGGADTENVHQLHNHGKARSASDTEIDPQLMAYPTRAEAEAKAAELGCKGAHSMGSHWMPCDDHASH
ncbi:MAG: Uncharacterised protein [Prochlorococcus marinus str. MIT 9215]|nr:MAG: Uncharacterised protein [Prochlorococcus marinus str. MIT 9215]